MRYIKKNRDVLSGIQTAIADYILRNPICKRRNIMNSIYADRKDGGPETENNISVQIHKINAKLKSQGIRIVSEHKLGYKFIQLDKVENS